MKLTYVVAILGSMLAFTACDDGVDESTTRVEERETTEVVPVPVERSPGSVQSSSSSTQRPMPQSPAPNSGAQSSSQSTQPADPPDLPPRDEEVNVTVEQPAPN